MDWRHVSETVNGLLGVKVFENVRLLVKERLFEKPLVGLKGSVGGNKQAELSKRGMTCVG
jgi:hypothetical protein